MIHPSLDRADTADGAHGQSQNEEMVATYQQVASQWSQWSFFNGIS